MAYNPAMGGFGNLLSGVPGAVDFGGDLSNPAPSVPAAIKPGAWSKDGKAWKILGIIGDAMQAATGGQGTYLPAFMDLQKQTADERKRQQELAQAATALQHMGRTPDEIAALQSGAVKYSDLVAKPSEDSFLRALDAAGIKEGTPEYVALARKRAEMLTNPVQLVSDGMGGQVAVRPNSAPVGSLPHANSPEDIAHLAPGSQFIAPDGSIRIVPGGPTQPASGGFR